jgi:DNA polymerase III delta subunit
VAIERGSVMKKSSAQGNSQEGPSAIHLFYGDEFLVKEEVQKLVKEVLEPLLRDTNLIVLDGNNLDISLVTSHVFTPSLFGGHRVIVVDQTTLFMSRADRGKIVAKVVDAWQSGDRKGSFKAFAQLLSLAGVTAQDVQRGPEGVTDAIEDSVPAQARDVVARVTREYFSEERKPVKTNDESALEELIQQPFPPGTTLVFTAPDVDKRKKIFKLAEKVGRIRECAAREEKYGGSLDRSFFDDRVLGALHNAGKTISGPALDRMYARSGKELRRLHSEVDKLIGYVGARTEVTMEDVESVFSDFHEASPFDLNNAIRTGDIAKCLPALHENLTMVGQPLQTLGIVAGEIRRLMMARELLFTVFRGSWKVGMSASAFMPALRKAREQHPELVKKDKFHLLSMNDYALYYALRDAQKFTLDKLVLVMEKILEADIMLKSTRLASHAAEEVLEEVIFAVCSQERPSEKPAARGKH